MAQRSTNPQGPYTDPWNLDQAGVDNAREYYRQQNDADFGNPLAQAVHMGQAAQATTPDPQGLKGLMQALKERGAVAGRSLDLPDSPTGLPSTYDPSFQTSAVAPSLSGLSRVVKGSKKARI